ncbi:hypothetical protein Leryth_005272 [Lithospermum erythrorhizon]|nr:hypothetical protein Leryth_005272 [Lithospermum erythrorhizon]
MREESAEIVEEERARFGYGLMKSSYRHSKYVYNKACEVLMIYSNSKIVYDVVEGYRGEGYGVVDIKMFKVVLNLCKEAKDADLAMWVLRKMKEFDCRPDTVVYSVVIRLLCEKDEWDEVMGLMREMESIDVYPGVSLYVVMIKGLCEAGKLEDACVLMKKMKGHGCFINVVVFTCLLDAVCKYGSSERALELLKDMEKEGGNCKPNVGLCEEGHVEEAYKVIEKVAAVIQGLYDDCYSSLLLSLWRIGRYQEAESLFQMMLANGLRPDGAASSTLIKGRLLDAFLLHEEFERSGSVSTIDSDIYSILLAGLRQENHSVEAAKLARIMARKGIKLTKDFGE